MSEALQLPGVFDVITAKDIPGKKVRAMSGYDEELLAETEVEHKCLCVFVCQHLGEKAGPAETCDYLV